MTKAFLPGVARKEGHPPPAGANEDGGEVTLSGRTPGKKPSKNLGGPGRLILFTLLIFLLSQIIAAFIAELGLAVIHPGSKQSLNDTISGQFAFILLAEGLAAWLVFWLVRRRGVSLGTIGLGRRPQISDLYKALLGFGVFYILLIIASLLVNNLSPELVNQKQNIGFNNIRNSTENVLAFVSLVILPPLGEEILVRGYLYSGLRRVWKFMPALVVTSLFFGVAHLEFGTGTPLVWAAAIDTFLLSVVLVYLREKTGALYASMLVHMLNNLIAFLVVIK
ncbi:CPBP family intramembrane metalloprotease [Candidatus Saccharibacteria bacterium]|nr:CPBP family intramembrane metalloprotease [Candidatus Saccharibacteria bacterium]